MALYVPNPDRGSVEDLIEELSRELAARYRNAEDELIREVAKRALLDQRLAAELPTAAAGRGLTVAERRRQNRILAELAAHRAAALRDLQARAMAIVSQLRSEDLARHMIETAAAEGEAAAAAQMGFARRQAASVIPLPVVGGQAAVSATTLTSTATQAVAALVLNLDSRLEILNQRITRYPQDAYQRIVSLYSPNTILGVSTSRVQQAQAVQRFLSEGIPAFWDESKPTPRRWTIGAYAEMAGRTSVNRAFNDAAVWRMGQSGIDLVTIVRGLDSCRKCAEWAGKILSTNGVRGTVTVANPLGGTETVDVAGSLDDARNGGWNHPNCRCRVAPYLAGVTVISDDSTYDPEAEQERAEQRRLEREIRAAKRREASAMSDTDAARAAAEVRAAQADMREFIARTGRRRDSYREQLHFADGRGSAGRARSTPPSAAPRGPSVQYRVGKSTKLGAAARHSVTQMRAVHSIPNTISPVTIERLITRDDTKLGQYTRRDTTLRLNPNVDGVEFTAVHELGHWLDNKAFGDDVTYGSQARASDAWKAWQSAVDASTPTVYLKRVLALQATQGASNGELAKHIRYMLDPKEQFARSYAQWVATKSADPVLRRQLLEFQQAANYTLRAYQWADDDFREIAAALDAIFKDRGMLK